MHGCHCCSGDKTLPQIQLHLNIETDRLSIKNGQAAGELTVACLAYTSLTSASCNKVVPVRHDKMNESLEKKQDSMTGGYEEENISHVDMQRVQGVQPETIIQHW